MRNVLVITLAATVLVAAAGLQSASPSARDGGKKDASQDKDFEQLKGMLLNRPEIPVTPPRGYKPPPKAKPDLPPEGTMIVDTLCRIDRDAESGWLVVLFDKNSDGYTPPPRKLLPCRLLEQMERIYILHPHAVFRISGETLKYRDKVYLLLHKVVYMDTATAKPKAETRPATRPAAGRKQKPKQKPRQKSAKLPAGSSGKQPASSPVRKQPVVSTEEIMTKLMQDRPGKPVVAPIVPPKREVLPAPSVAPTQKKPVKPGHSDLAVDRLVRILPSPGGQWMMAHFEADNTLQEPPVRLLPCRNLQVAENLVTAARGRAIKFRITGQITYYRGKRYMILRKLIRERDMGRL